MLHHPLLFSLWMPLPSLLYAQVVKTVHLRRLIRVRHKVVSGILATVEQVLAMHGWHINTTFIEPINLAMREHVAAVGRRVTTLCKGEDGLQPRPLCSYGGRRVNLEYVSAGCRYNAPGGINCIISGSAVGLPGGNRKPSCTLQPILVCTFIVPYLYGKCHTAASPLVPAKSASPRWQWDALCDIHSRLWASWCDVRRCERHFPARDFGLQWDDT